MLSDRVDSPMQAGAASTAIDEAAQTSSGAWVFLASR
jgi:hypothetical protein